MPRVKLFDRDEVLERAMEMFWKNGYNGTSMDQLVKYMGISRASLYDTFGDKEQLFKKSFELYRATTKEGLIEFFKNHPDVKEGFSKLFNKAIDEAIVDEDKKGCFVVNATTELIPNDESLQKVLIENKCDFQNLFYEYLKAGKEKGQLKNSQDLKAIATYPVKVEDNIVYIGFSE